MQQSGSSTVNHRHAFPVGINSVCGGPHRGRGGELNGPPGFPPEHASLHFLLRPPLSPTSTLDAPNVESLRIERFCLGSLYEDLMWYTESADAV